MKIWKTDKNRQFSKESESVFYGTGIDNHASAHRAEPFSLDKPTVIFLPGKNTIINCDGMPHDGKVKEPLSSQIDKSFKEINDVYQLYVGTRDSENAPEFYTLAYTDNMLSPPSTNQFTKRGTIKQAVAVLLDSVTDADVEQELKGSRLLQIFTHTKRPGDFFSHDAKMFVDDMLMPALMDDEDALLSPNEMKVKLDNLTLIGHSYGSIFCKEIENRLHMTLSKRGMDEVDIKDVLKHVVTINPCSIARVRDTKNSFTGYYFEGRLDTRRRFTQNRDSEQMRGVIFKKQAGEYLVVANSQEREEFPNKGMEFRQSVGADNRIHLPNSMLILYDVPSKYASKAESLDQVYDSHFDLPMNNKHHHMLGSVLFSDPKKQGHVLLFNRILQNAIERGTDKTIDMDDEMSIREMLVKQPSHDMTPEHMRGRFDRIVSDAFKRGGLSPSTQFTTRLKLDSRPAKDVKIT